MLKDDLCVDLGMDEAVLDQLAGQVNAYHVKRQDFFPKFFENCAFMA
jgi:hypothetical protein